jgi:hypothetical protein
MAKNILIFSDGTGMAGGITFDEDRTNIYKLYRATRCRPDSCIHPKDQVAFYDPGLGSPADGGFIFGKIGRWFYNLAAQATGLGITANIIDCYAALIRLYRDGDRVFLFGFSRGAYTVRCLGAVIAFCGIPRHLPDGKPLPLDVKGSRKLATEAVANVYQFCSSKPRKALGSYRNFMLDTRAAIAAHFRQQHGSADPPNALKANVYPYFIGVFDTVAALGRPGAVVGLIAILAAALGGISYAASLLPGLSGVSGFHWLALFTFPHVATVLYGAVIAAGVLAYVGNYLKFDFHVPGYSWWKSLLTIHLAPPKHTFTDYTLNVNVSYAKHAISIDENRKDFKRVIWIPDDTKIDARDSEANLYFEQVWFSGVHADVGGGYIENESRLSDLTLGWMLAAASLVPNGLKFDPSVLRGYPDASGPQHDECKAGHWQKRIRDLPAGADHLSRAIMHRSVYLRFEAGLVVLYEQLGLYRPPNLACHVDFQHYYDSSKKCPTELRCVADNVEQKWLKRQSMA